MPRFARFVAVCAVLTLPTFCLADDESDVKAGFRRFAEALGHQDLNRVLDETDRTADERPFVEALEKFAYANRMFVHALVVRFHPGEDESKVYTAMLNGGLEQLDKAVVAVHGNHASIYRSGGSPRDGLRMERIGGVWKFHAVKYPHDTDRFADYMSRWAAAVDEVSDNVNGGRYATYQPAFAAWKRAIFQPVLDDLMQSDLFANAPKK